MSGSKNESFPKNQRVLSSKQFTAILRNGAYAADGVLVAFVLPQNDSDSSSTSRLGITIPKKLGNAVRRNAWKRHIREAYRTAEGIPLGLDIVIRPKRDAPLDRPKITAGLPKLIRRAKNRLEQRNMATGDGQSSASSDQTTC